MNQVNITSPRSLARRAVVSATLALGIAWMGAATAQSAFPSRPIRLIVGYNPGAATDIIAREFAKGLSDRLRTPVIVENKSGANTVIASAYVANSPPDGYTLLISNSSNATNPWVYANLGYDYRQGLQNVALMGIVYNLVTASSRSPVSSVRELIAFAKQKPNEFSYGSVGVGSAQHLLVASLAKQAGVELNHIPYRGAVAAMQDVMGGAVSGMVGTITSQREMVRAGALKALFVTSGKRSQFMPEVPTLAESGFPSLVSGYWIGLSGPAGMKAEVVERINREVNEILKSPEVLERLSKQSIEPMGGTPADMDRFFEAELRFWKDAAKAANLTPTAAPLN